MQKSFTIILISFLILLLSACGGGSTNEQGDNSGYKTKLYIKSAIYDNNRTSSVNDDRLYIYFNKDINPSSISTDANSNYDINGTGTIGSASSSEYNKTIFYRQKISLNSSGTASSIFETNSTKISLKQNQITSINGKFPIDLNQTTVKEFNVFARLYTGQTTSYIQYDDANTTRGLSRNFIRDNTKEIVTDTITGIMWQDNSDVNTSNQDWNASKLYCENLSLGGYDNWYLPSIDELVSITDKGRYNPSIDPMFKYVATGVYFTETRYIYKPNYVWTVSFNYGEDHYYNKTNSKYVRCARHINN